MGRFYSSRVANKYGVHSSIWLGADEYWVFLYESVVVSINYTESPCDFYPLKNMA